MRTEISRSYRETNSITFLKCFCIYNLNSHASFVYSGTRFAQDEIEMYCDMNEKECFFKCVEKTGCLSFTVGMNESCTGTFCLLHSMSKIKHSHLLEDDNSTYYFMVRCE